ncbi:hypothetical protein MRX96_022844 [Rhipicephalus microplus]
MFGNQNPFGTTTGFGTAGSAFGTSAFGATTTPSTGGGLFGGTTTQTGSLFGSTGSSFGQPSTSTTPGFGFGAPATGSSMFGTMNQQPAASTGIFGASSSSFGQPRPQFGSSFSTTTPATGTSLFGQPQSTGLFGQTAGSSLFGSTAFGTGSVTTGTTIKFKPPTGTDTMMKNGVSSTISTSHQCITCMKEYENKSLEELRLEDYAANRKGGGQAGMQSTFNFGATQNKPLFGTSTTGSFAPTGGSLFGQATTQSQNVFGKPTGFGMTTPASTSAFWNQHCIRDHWNLCIWSATAKVPVWPASRHNTLWEHNCYNTAFHRIRHRFWHYVWCYNAAECFRCKANIWCSHHICTFRLWIWQHSQHRDIIVWGQAAIAVFLWGNHASVWGNQHNRLWNIDWQPLWCNQDDAILWHWQHSCVWQHGLWQHSCVWHSWNKYYRGDCLVQPLRQSPQASTLEARLLLHLSQASAKQVSGLVLLLAVLYQPWEGKNVLKETNKREELLKPTNPAAQQALLASHYKVSPVPAPKLRPKPVGAQAGKTSSLFEGLEDEEDIIEPFTPRQSVKTLIIKPKDTPDKLSASTLLASPPLATNRSSTPITQSSSSPSSRTPLAVPAKDSGLVDGASVYLASSEPSFTAPTVQVEKPVSNLQSLDDAVSSLEVRGRKLRFMSSSESLDDSSQADPAPDPAKPPPSCRHCAHSARVLHRSFYGRVSIYGGP